MEKQTDSLADIYCCVRVCVKGALGAERSICVLKGSSVNLTCFAKDPAAPKSWYYLKENKTLRVMKEISEISASFTYNVTEDGTLTIRDVHKSDGYSFCCQESYRECLENRTKLHVTGTNKVYFFNMEAYCRLLKYIDI